MDWRPDHVSIARQHSSRKKFDYLLLGVVAHQKINNSSRLGEGFWFAQPGSCRSVAYPLPDFLTTRMRCNRGPIKRRSAAGRCCQSGASASCPAGAKRQALVAERPFGNIRATAGREDRFRSVAEGVPLAELHAAEAEALIDLVEVFCSRRLAAALAERQARRIREGDVMAARFAWAGGDREDDTIYYRVHGETFLVEFATLRNQPLHHHAVWHDLDHNFGDHAL